MSSSSVSGILAPHMVPLDDSGRIAEPELRRHVSWLIDRGIHGLYPNGSTGEFLRFTPEERGRITAIVCDEARGRVPVVAGAAEANVTETLRACRRSMCRRFAASPRSSRGSSASRIRAATFPTCCG